MFNLNHFTTGVERVYSNAEDLKGDFSTLVGFWAGLGWFRIWECIVKSERDRIVTVAGRNESKSHDAFFKEMN